MVTYNSRTYKTGSSCGGSNMDLKLINCEDKVYIESIILSNV